MGEFSPFHWLLVILIGFVIVIPFWQIFKKAGFPPWLSLFLFIPVVGAVVLYYVAFAEWPEKSK